jgi:hypothetical protein
MDANTTTDLVTTDAELDTDEDPEIVDAVIVETPETEKV